MIGNFEDKSRRDLPPAMGEIVGVVCPHAGYVYSGATAARSFLYARAAEPDTVVVTGLAHHYPLSGVSILEAKACSTPLGEIECDVEFAEILAESVSFSQFQRDAHLSEHSVETQFPFVKKYFPSARVVEILTRDDRLPLVESLGRAIADTTTALGRKVLLVASTDLSHYPSMEVAERVDSLAMESFLSLDPQSAAHEIAEIESEGLPGVSCAVCSKASVLSGMCAAAHLGAEKGTFLGYANSGMVPGGDPDRVVGYGAVAWSRSS